MSLSLLEFDFSIFEGSDVTVHSQTCFMFMLIKRLWSECQARSTYLLDDCTVGLVNSDMSRRSCLQRCQMVGSLSGNDIETIYIFHGRILYYVVFSKTLLECFKASNLQHILVCFGVLFLSESIVSESQSTLSSQKTEMKLCTSL